MISFIYFVTTIMLFSELGVPFATLLGVLIIWHVTQWKYIKYPPSNLLLNIVAIIGMTVLSLSIGLSNSVSLFVSLMILACQLKVIQAKNNKQNRQILILNFFTIPCIFLFSQNLLTTIAVVLLLIINLGVLAAISHKHTLLPATKSAFKSVIMLIPVSMLLVVFLPKIPSFWQLPGAQVAKTGLSENVDPFNISELSQSDDLAFRAIIDTPSSYSAPFYWRAIIHDSFDGKSWRMANEQTIPIAVSNDQDTLGYKVIAEPSNLPWLFSLGYSVSDTDDVSTNRFGTLFNAKNKSRNFEYNVQTTSALTKEFLTRWEYKRFTQLPQRLNPRASQLAQQWDYNSESIQDFITLMRAYFISQGFQYTLSPEVIQGENKIDMFLFEKKSGFCGHYASSVAMMMRSVGIPSRLVSGYLGAEYNEANNYYSVYQYDAHAWVEYFIPKSGWHRLDPTAWVSPERLSGSLSQHTTLSEQFKSNLGISLVALSGVPGMEWLRLKLEEYDYKWTRWVLNFDHNKQQSFLRSLLGNNAQIVSGAITMISLVCLCVFIFWFLQRKPNVKRPISVTLYEQLKSVSSFSENNLTPLQFISKLSEQFPEHKNDLHIFYAHFSAARYEGKTFANQQRKSTLKLIRSIKTKTKRKL
jgi:transglutaminase-like putative cysteine protease